MIRPLTSYFFATGAWFLAYGMQTVLFAWLVTIVLNASPDKVGIAQMAYLLPGTLFMLIGGSIADQYGGRRIALIGQSLAAIIAAGLAVSMMLTSLSYEKFLLFAVCMGCAQAILTPARDGILPLVADGQIQRRVAQVSLIQFGVQMIGILIASLADALGAIVMLSIQSVVLTVGVFAYQTLRIPLIQSARTQSSILHQLGASIYEGFNSVKASSAMRVVVLQNVAMGICFMGSYIVTIPLLIREVYSGSSTEMSIVNAANSLGLFLTIMILLRFGDIARKGRALLTAQGLGALVLAATALDLPFSFLTGILFFWGMCGGIAMTMARTIMQEHSPEDQRGRMMAFYAFSFMGAGPIGALISGYLVAWFGPSSALAIASLAMFAVVISVRLRSDLWKLT
ncbi:MAG: MFS transporter [Pseudomonadales bacterium]|nr:MFS transporter [Pseudomonadales bacterium]MDA0760491.1 MFS transporter [Pseudomonadota bacterium]MDA0957104.1 MFS transporter [Pseudomonadota bacterium]MDA1206679.1 MFS transporter [Pseudomonadota bacterium]